MKLEENLAEMERERERYWSRYPSTSPFKLRWRAIAVRHCFHVLPGETILELGAGSGLWTEHLTDVLRGENPIVATVFNDDFAAAAAARKLPNLRFQKVTDLADLPAESFDYVVGTAILCHDLYAQNLQAIHRLLKPGGQILFFEANYWNPQAIVKSALPGRWTGQSSCHAALRKYELMRMASQQGFIDIDVIPYDIIHPLVLRFAIPALRSLAFVVEHAPLIKEMCGTLYIRAQKPGNEAGRRESVNLANHRDLYGSTSFVVPCRNEEMNIGRLVDALVRYYGPYVHEIVIVNDNSTDRTAEVTREIARREPRVKLVDRELPGGVGRALRDGYAAATGQYIFTMDCDFVQILPEFRDLFDAVARGRDGAIGSRFSHDSLLINYPFFKIFCNRSFHLLANILLPVRMRDISNNLKLYKSEILKTIGIDQPHFAANVETGLKPLLAGYDIEEVPISWIDRTIDMGSSSFRIANVAPSYFMALAGIVWKSWRERKQLSRLRQANLAGGFQTGQTQAWRSTIQDSCPICRSVNTRLHFDAEDDALHPSIFGSSRSKITHGRILRCVSCGFGFRQVRSNTAQMAELYRRMDVGVYESETPGRKATAARHLELLKRFTARIPGKVLDAGCASGHFLREARRAGWLVAGAEPSETLFAKARQTLGTDAELHCSILEQANLTPSSFDAITLWDVLEHVPEPAAFMRLCCTLLKPGGKLFVNVPDLDSIEARVLGEKWPLLLAEHLNYFNRKSLRLCGEMADLKWVHFGRRRVSFSLDYILFRLSQHRIPGAGFARKVIGPALAGVSLPIYLGETFGVWSR
jgi:2-polyprenyl-3-methyl-5-hydroxy-6-metoxy-1,4-benzoquinol methylase/glycosyltransferase involved in cell wall biosynthesis